MIEQQLEREIGQLKYEMAELGRNIRDLEEENAKLKRQLAISKRGYFDDASKRD